MNGAFRQAFGMNLLLPVVSYRLEYYCHHWNFISPYAQNIDIASHENENGVKVVL